MHQFETAIIPRKVSAAAMLLFVLALPQHLTAASPPKGAICSTAISTSDFTPYVIPAGIATAELDYIVSNSVGPDKGLVCHIETYTCGYESKVYPPVLATVTVTDGGGVVRFSDTQTSVTDTYPVDNRGFPLGMIPSARTFNYVAHIDVHTLTATSDGTVYVTVNGPVSASVSYSQPPPTFAFDYSSSDPDQEVLAHKYEASDSFPLGLDRFGSQRQINVGFTDVPQVRIRGAVSLSGSGVKRDVYFRLIDPPDKAAYVPAANRTVGDNRDSAVKRGHLYVQDVTDHFVLDASGNRITNDPATGILQTKSRDDGGVTLVLETTDHAAGDNYQIEVSFDKVADFDPLGPDQPCMTCTKSATYVVWKRIYVEQHWMFKHGSWFSHDVATGDTDLFVADLHDFRNGDHIVLLHAKAASGDDFDGEPHTIDVVANNRRTGVPAHLHLTDSAASRAYAADQTTPYLSDAVGIANSAIQINDYYAPEFGPSDPTTHLTPVEQYFALAFVEVRPAPARFQIVPLYDKAATDGNSPPADDYANRWIESVDLSGTLLPNHRALFGGAHADDASTIGVTLLPSLHTSFSFRKRITEAVSEVSTIAGLDPTIVSYENAAHELSHQWRVNFSPIPSGGDGFGHCAFNAYDNAHMFCHMHAPWSTPEDEKNHDHERGDGVMKLHFSSPPPSGDSEYLTIRTAAEPMP